MPINFNPSNALSHAQRQYSNSGSSSSSSNSSSGSRGSSGSSGGYSSGGYSSGGYSSGSGSSSSGRNDWERSVEEAKAYNRNTPGAIMFNQGDSLSNARVNLGGGRSAQYNDQAFRSSFSNGRFDSGLYKQNINNFYPAQKTGEVQDYRTSSGSPTTDSPSYSSTADANSIENRYKKIVEKFGENSAMAQHFKRLVDEKNSRPENSTGKHLNQAGEQKPDISDLEFDPLTKKVIDKRTGLAIEKGNELLSVEEMERLRNEAESRANDEKWQKRFDDLQGELNHYRDRYERNAEANYQRTNANGEAQKDALTKQNAGRQAAALRQAAEAGVSPEMLANIGGQIASDANYAGQMAEAEQRTINELVNQNQNNLAQYRSIVSDKTNMTKTQADMARKLLEDIKEGNRRIAELKKQNINDKYAPTEKVVDKRLEDTVNKEMSFQQNREDQSRWERMNDNDRNGKLLDGLYRYDQSINRSNVTPEMLAKARAIGNYSEAIAYLANMARNPDKENSSSNSSGSSNGNSYTPRQTGSSSSSQSHKNTGSGTASSHPNNNTQGISSEKLQAIYQDAMKLFNAGKDGYYTRQELLAKYPELRADNGTNTNTRLVDDIVDELRSQGYNIPHKTGTIKDAPKGNKSPIETTNRFKNNIANFMNHSTISKQALEKAQEQALNKGDLNRYRQIGEILKYKK